MVPLMGPVTPSEVRLTKVESSGGSVPPSTVSKRLPWLPPPKSMTSKAVRLARAAGRYGSWMPCKARWVRTGRQGLGYGRPRWHRESS